jgi:hypothetical protein
MSVPEMHKQETLMSLRYFIPRLAVIGLVGRVLRGVPLNVIAAQLGHSDTRMPKPISSMVAPRA